MRQVRTAMLRLCVAVAAVAVTACGAGTPDGGRAQGSPDSITVYSGRSQELVAPLFAQFEQDTGIRVAARYGDTAELAAQILEEGDNSPADVFFAQDAGALGALAAEDRLADLDDEILDAVAPRFRSRTGEWVGISGRVRTVVYNTDRVSADELPSSILDFTDARWNARIGWAPTNGSLQAFVTALRKLEGDEAARQWLEGIRDNGARSYAKNTAIVEAVAAGEVDVGFVNHYYVMQLRAQRPDLAAANHFMAAGDAGSLVNVAGAGILRTSDAADAAARFITFLLSDEVQRYFASETYEYPLAYDVPADAELPQLDELQPPDLDLSDLADLQGTLTMLQQARVV